MGAEKYFSMCLLTFGGEAGPVVPAADPQDDPRILMMGLLYLDLP